MIIRLFFLFGLLAGCTSATNGPILPKNLILVSIAPYQFLMEKIGGDAVVVETIIPRHANPHTFEPTSKEVLSISQAAMWFRIGEPFEKKLLPILKAHNPELAIHDLREEIDLQFVTSDSCKRCSFDHLDRHIWLNPKLAAIQAEKIATILQNRFPEKKEVFRDNLFSVLKELEELDSEVRSLLECLQKRTFIVSHPAFGYFAREYQLEQVSVEQEGKDPRPRYLEEILQKINPSYTRLALALPQHNNKGLQLIAKKMDLPLQTIDPYAPRFFDTIRSLARLLADPYTEKEPR